MGVVDEPERILKTPWLLAKVLCGVFVGSKVARIYHAS
jgi:hypothetical protein